MSVISLGILVGLDNLAVASGLGMLGLGRRRRLWYAASCFGFETAASLIGLTVGLDLRGRLGPVAGWLAPGCLAVCGLIVLNTAMRRHQSPSFIDKSYAMLLFPFLLSLDNLAAGVGMGVSGSQELLDGLVIGAISGAMAVGGFALGGHVRVRLASFANAFAGAVLLASAAIFLLVDLS
jgi:putative Mn2+ efflux pump MntP